MATERKPEVTIELKPEGTPDAISASDTTRSSDIARGIKTGPWGEPRRTVYATYHRPRLLFPKRDGGHAYTPDYRTDL